MAGTSSYNNDKVVTGEVEYPANDPASGAFFQADYKKNDDLKAMLDGSKDSLKLEAMKRIIGMIAKGRDASDLFPAVVKNVVSKNIEVKKLVYVYLVRYAEEQQDLALLSISTFQRALKDPNQLIRASALRVLSSSRCAAVAPVVALAVHGAAADMSPYVRKTAAHAIPKLYSLDPDQKEELVSLIERLLSDKAPLVVGSAAMAFTEVCPDRLSLIHKCYRKLCLLLADVDEWGQMALLNVLTVYAQLYFTNPNTNRPQSASSSESDRPVYDDEESQAAPEADLRLLLRASRPLLQSRNSGVVLATARLYYQSAPTAELPPVCKSLVRLLRAPVEIQSVVLTGIAALTVNHRSLFEPFLKSFFVRNSDPTHIKLLKLEILTNLATEANASAVLREFQTYVSSNDKQFAAATIQAIGRLALAIESEMETCLNGLLQLLSSKDERSVDEAVVVVKRVVGGGGPGAAAAVRRAAALLRTDRLCGSARAAGVWLVAAHGAREPRAAAVLAHLAASFTLQEELVKLQILTLAMKLTITQPDTLPLAQYIIQLSRYDPSFDVRDRGRMLAARLASPRGNERIFCTDKPRVQTHSRFKDRSQFPLGSLSQCTGRWAPHSACLAPTTSLSSHEVEEARLLRQVADTQVYVQQTHAGNTQEKNKSFYSEPNSSDTHGSSSSDSETSSEESSDDNESGDEEKKKERDKTVSNNAKASSSGSSDSESDSSSSESDGSDTDTDEEQAKGDHSRIGNEKPTNSKGDKSNLELLLELDEMASSLPTMTPTCGGMITPTRDGTDAADEIVPVGPAARGQRTESLLPRVSASGLEVTRVWTRAPHLYSDKMVAVSLHVANHTGNVIENVAVVEKKGAMGARALHPGSAIQQLEPGAADILLNIGLDFADSIQPIEFTITCSLGDFPVSITPPVGELMRAVSMSEPRWDREQNKLRGMNECEKKISKVADEQTICQRVYEKANVHAITDTGNHLRFAGRMMSSRDLVLLSVKTDDVTTTVRANCSNMAVASLLANQIAQALAR